MDIRLPINKRENFKPRLMKLAATKDGGALTCHKGFIIYGIKFVQKEFVNLILGRPIDYERKGRMTSMGYNPPA